MSQNLTHQQQELIEKNYRSIEKELAKGNSTETIARKLIKQGWPKESAVEIVNDIKNGIESPEWRQMMASKFKRHMVYGVLWAIGGIAVTIITYVTSSISGVYLIAWGAILWGLIDFFRGLVGWLKFRKQNLPF